MLLVNQEIRTGLSSSRFRPPNVTLFTCLGYLTFFFTQLQDNVLDCIRKTHISFIRCMLPAVGAGKYDLSDPADAARASSIAGKMDVPLLRDQLKRAQVIDAVRLHRQGNERGSILSTATGRPLSCNREL